MHNATHKTPSVGQQLQQNSIRCANALIKGDSGAVFVHESCTLQLRPDVRYPSATSMLQTVLIVTIFTMCDAICSLIKRHVNAAKKIEFVLLTINQDRWIVVMTKAAL